MTTLSKASYRNASGRHAVTLSKAPTIRFTFHISQFTPSIHRAVLETAPPPPAIAALENGDGFWELSFRGQAAVLPQHQGLFYVAYLLQHPPAEPLSATELETAVYQQFGEHEDFVQSAPTIWAKSDRAEALRLLRRREQALHKIIDSRDALDPVKTEAMDELVELETRQQAQLDQFVNGERKAGESIWAALVGTYNLLALAVAMRGAPHPLIRAFARHLLVHLLMPSRRATHALGSGHFTYQP